MQATPRPLQPQTLRMRSGIAPTLALVVTLSGSLAAPSNLSAQDLDQPIVDLVLDGRGKSPIRMAFPTSQSPGTPSGLSSATTTLDATIRGDLSISGVVVLDGPEQLSVLELTGNIASDLESYRSLGNQALLLVKTTAEGDRMVVDARVVDFQTRQDIYAKRYRGGYDLARRIGHIVADDIILYYSGRRGLGQTRIAFWSDRNGFKEIYLMEYDGSSQKPVTAHKSISMSPAWSPQSDGLSYVSFVGGLPNVYFADLASGRKRALLAKGAHNTSPTFSPDGSKIAFASSTNGNWEVFTANRDGGNLRQLTHSKRIDTNPSWSPNGREIAFTSNRGGQPQIYVMDAEGANVRRVSFGGTYADGAAWSPNGSVVAFASRRGGSFDLAVSHLVTGESRFVTAGGANDETPTFSPDGRRIAFASDRSGRAQVYVVDVEGREVTQLTSSGTNRAPDWSPYLQ